MKNRWLIASLLVFVSLFIESYGKLFYLLIAVCYWCMRYKDKSVWLFIAISLVFIYYPFVPKVQEGTAYTISEIHPYYMVLKNGNLRIKTKNLSGVSYDDVIKLKGEISRIEEDYYFATLSNEKYYGSKGIFYEAEIVSYEVIEKGNSIRRKIWDQISNLDSDLSSFYKQILFSYNDYGLELDDDLSSLINSSGIYLSSFVSFLRSLLSLFFYEKTVQSILSSLLLTLGFVYDFDCNLYRLIFNILLSKVENREDRLGLLILCLLFINPYYRYSLSFLISISIRFVSLFNKDRSVLTSFLALIPLQLSYSSEFSFCSSITYSLFRNILFYVWLLCLFCLSINRYGILHPVIHLLEKNKVLNFWNFSGKPNLIWILLWIQAASIYLNKKDPKILMTLSVLLFLNQNQSLLRPMDTSCFLNVANGNSFVYLPAFSNSVLLLDTGSSYQYKKVKNYLNSLGIRKIDVLLVSHMDEDHSGNMNALKKDFIVKNVFTEKKEEIVFKNIKLIGLLTDDIYTDINSNSAIYLTQIGNLVYLFTGDISKETERDFVRQYPNLKADILKVSHHGSYTASSLSFLKNSPFRLAVISCGDYQIYHHSSEETMKNLVALRISAITTKTSGDIRIDHFFNKNILFTAKKEIYFIQ